MQERQCISCKKTGNRDDFIKITKIKSDEIVINPSSKEFGRSAYICKNKECIRLALKNKYLYKKLKTKNAESVSKIENILSNTAF